MTGDVLLVVLVLVVRDLCCKIFMFHNMNGILFRQQDMVAYLTLHRLHLHLRLHHLLRVN